MSSVFANPGTPTSKRMSPAKERRDEQFLYHHFLSDDDFAFDSAFIS